MSNRAQVGRSAKAGRDADGWWRFCLCQSKLETVRRVGWLPSVLWLLCLVWLGVSVAACEDTDDGTTPIADSALPPLGLTDQTPSLIVSWIDERGETHTGTALSDVPDSAKEHVRIVTQTGGHGALFYVADLTKKNEDGTYSVETTRARDWEKRIQDRRDAYRKKHAPPPVPKASGSATPDPAPSGGISAVVYGAVWCGPCHQAKKYLERRGVKVSYYDIEKEPARAKEMHRKLRGAGKSGGTIPVIDINGVIMQGFSARAVERELKKAARPSEL
jgi:glutaredoxin